MSDRMKRELSININTNVDTQPIKSAEKELNRFFTKYENKSIELGIDQQNLKIDTKDFYRAIAAAQQLERSIDGVSKSAPMMMKALNNDIEFASNVRDELKDAMAAFDDGSLVRGIDNIANKIASGFSVIAVDLGGRIQYLKDQISSALNDLEFDGVQKFYDGSINFSSGNMDKAKIKERINLIKELFDYQEELEKFNGAKFEEKDAPLGHVSGARSALIEQLEKDYQSLEKYNLETTKQLRRREEIIRTAQGVYWDENTHAEAKKNVMDESAYEEAIENLEWYISYKKSAIEDLKAAEDELFSVDGISKYVESANEDIARMQERMKELKTLRDGPTEAQDAPIIADLTEVLAALEKIESAIKSVADAFEPLTSAFANEESAIHAMVNSNVNQLNELVNKFKEVHDMVDSLNKKEFNITNVTQNVAGKSDTSSVLDTYQTEANNLLKTIAQINDEILGTFGNTGLNAFGIDKSVLNKLFDLARNESQFKKDITKSKGIASIQNIYTELYEQYLQAVFKASSKVNEAIPGFIDISKLDKIKNVREMKESALDAKTLSGVTESIVNDVEKNADVNVDTGKILNQIQTLGQQVQEELKTIRQQIEATFDFSSIDPSLTNVQSITEKIYQQFEELQQNIKKLDFNIEAPNMDGVVNAINVIKQEGEVAEGATPKKDAFTAANQKLAESMMETGEVGKVAADGVKTEADAVEQAVKAVTQSSKKIMADQNTIIDKYKNIYGGKGKVNTNLASNFNKAIDMADIDVSSIRSSFGTKSYKDKDGTVIEYDYIKLIADGTDALGKATTVTREYEVATGGLIKKMASFKEVKDTFNVSQEVETANSKVAELENRMGSFKIDLEAVKQAAAGISDEASLEVFEKSLEAANQKLKELKATLKSSKSLDPVVNSESMMSNLETTVQTYRENIKKFSDVEGFGELEEHLKNITTYLNDFNDAKKLGDGQAMAEAVAAANKEIAKYNAQLNLVKARHQENSRVAKESEQARKKALDEEKALMKEISAEDKLTRDKDNQLSLLTKQQAQWEKNGQLTDEVRAKINAVFDSLVKVTSAEELSAWKKQWSTVKNEILTTKYEIEAAAKAQKEIDAERKTSRSYWDKEFQYSLSGLITPEKRPELEQLKAYMLQQAEITKEAVEEQYNALMTIVSSKNNALTNLMSAKGQNEKQRWQDDYSAWFGAWNALDKNKISEFFSDAGNQALLGADKIKKFNNELERSKTLDSRSKDQKDAIDAKISEQSRKQELAAEKALIAEEKALMKEIVAENKLMLDKDKQFALLSKQQAQWNKNGQLTDEVSQTINSMLDSLARVSDSDELAIWKKQWSIVKDEVLATKYEIEAATKAQKATANERKSSGTYWDKEFKYSLNNIIAPEKRPELEQLKAYMLQQAKSTEDAVKEQYDAIFTIVKSKNDSLAKLMAADGPNDKQYWQDQYSAWFGAWNKLDSDVVSNFFANAGNQAILGAGKIEEFNKELARSEILENKIKDSDYNKKQQELDKINKEKQKYGQSDYNRLNKFSESMHASIRELQSGAGVGATLDSLVADFDAAYTKIEAMRKQFNDDPSSVTDGMKTQFQDAVHHADDLRGKIADIFKESQKMSKIGTLIAVGKNDVSQVQDLKSEMIAFANSALEGKVTITGFNEKSKQMYVTLDEGAGAVKNITVALDGQSGKLQALATSTSHVTNEWEKFKSEVTGGIARTAGMYLGLNDIIRYGKQGVEYVKEIDLAMTELKKVTDETDASYKAFLKDAGSTAAVIGSTISDFTEATATFARLGYSMEESASMAETAIIYKNVAD